MPAVDGDVFPASYAQEGLWLLAQLAPDLPLYQVAVPIRLRLPMTVEGIEAALSAIARRHETLRTSLELQEDALVQVIHRQVSPLVRHTDFTSLPASARWDGVMETFYAELGEPVPLHAAPLWRANVVRCADDDWAVVFVAHHSIFDATSIMVLRRELRELAAAAVAGRAPVLPELPIQYADFAAWQRGQFADDAFAASLRYWRATLAGVPPVHRLPTDRQRPPVPTFAGGDVLFVIPPDTVRALHQVARHNGATPFTVLLAAYQALIARLSGDTDIVVGIPVAGRDLPELQPLIGMFVNTLALRIQLSGDPTFRDLVDRARHTLLDALEHQAVPFDILVAELAPQREAGRNPLFQIGLNYLPAKGPAGAGAEWISLAHDESFTLHDRPRAARFDVHLDLTEDGDQLVGVLEYASDLFDRATAQALSEQFSHLLDAAVRDPEIRLSRLPLLAPDERARLLAAPPPAPVELGIHSGALAGGGSVVGADGRRLTAGEVDRRADELAAVLIAHGASPDRVVAVLLPDSDPDLAVAMLGVLRAGAAMLPLDAGQAPQRTRFLLGDARPAVVVTVERLREMLPPTAVPVVCLDGAFTSDPPEPIPGTPWKPDSLALVSYPAMATGLPRAVAVTRANLSAQVAQSGRLLGLPPGATYALASPTPPEVLLAALAAGGEVHLLGSGAVSPPVAADYLVVPQSGLADLAGSAADGADWFPKRALLVDAGLPATEDAAAWHAISQALERRRPGCVAIRRYGSAETTGAALACMIGEGGGALGRPLESTAAYVLDQNLEPVPDGVTGELFLGGATVARGYLGRPGPTAERFIDAFPDGGGTRLFRTGTLVSRRRDGTLEPR